MTESDVTIIASGQGYQAFFGLTGDEGEPDWKYLDIIPAGGDPDDDVMQNPPADLVAAVQAAAIRAVGKKPEWCRRCTTRIYSHELCLGCAEEQREQDRLDDEKFQQGWEEAKI